MNQDNNNPLAYPKTDTRGRNWETGTFDFCAFVDDSHPVIESTSSRLMEMLLSAHPDLEKNTNGVNNRLAMAVTIALKDRYLQNLDRERPLTQKQIINSFYFVFERADLNLLVHQAYKKMQDKEANENVEDAIIQGIADVIIECVTSAHENHGVDDFWGYPFEKPVNTDSPLTITPALIEKFYQLLLKVGPQGNIKKLAEEKEKLLRELGRQKRRHSIRAASAIQHIVRPGKSTSIDKIRKQEDYIKQYEPVGLLLPDNMEKHLLAPNGEPLEGIELFRAVERIYHAMASSQYIAKLESTKSKLYDLIQNNVEFRHSAFNNGTFLSLAMAFASMTAGASAIKGVDQGLIIWASITIFGLWMAQGARATANVIEAYKRKVGIEFEQLLAVEEMLALLGSLVTPMYNEEGNYEFAQKTRGISASDAQKNNITGQRLGGSIAAGLGMVMVLVYLSKYVPTGDNESLYDMVKSIFGQ